MLKNSNDEFQSGWGVSIAAAAAIGTPDTIDFFLSFGPVIDAFIKLGQLGVVIVTIFYIVKKTKAIRVRRSRQKSNEQLYS